MQPPKLIYQAGSNGSVIISEGDTLHLDCNAYGIPSPQIYWIYGKHAQSKFKLVCPRQMLMMSLITHATLSSKP